MLTVIRAALIFATLAVAGATEHDNKNGDETSGNHLRGNQQRQPETGRELMLRSYHHAAHVGECPNWPQATGIACWQYIPMGATKTTCFYAATQCDCDTAMGITWTCQPKANVAQVTVTQETNEYKPQPPTLPPTQAPVNSININVVQNPITIKGQNPDCPAQQPQDQSWCPDRSIWFLSCTYWDSSKELFIQCDCIKQGIFICRPSPNPELGNQW
eukprot:CAMPEP_0197179730 /NCGR_PEP_ID=MMETSP1423-20130617/4577_1 /TAXON_ID=476441 /ORGANISM="Pseudo-nitzschia heimii, Strain UNC1101" /LENGTH=215 /DNA_ID=CAMNT_0042629675 /DNA_START=124 /DNA_END=768 /DNA_ORIENTATION=+